jgi:3-hydroxyisobutyrate dehydrogenase
MGLPMARNLVKAGFATRGFDVRESARTAFGTAGGMGVVSAAEAAQDADALVLMVVDSAQAQEVLFEAGALNALRKNALVILSATCPPVPVRAIAERVQATGRRFLDAPVSGGTVGAEAATLSIMAAGARKVFDAAVPVLKAIGDKIFYVGAEPGQGAAMKTVNQLLCGVHIAVAAEAVAFAEKVGLDLRTVLQIVGNSAASSWLLRDRGPRMMEAEPEVTSAIDIFVKDLGMVLDAGREAKAALPLAAIAHQMFVSTSGRGDGRADDSQVIRSYRLLNGTQNRTTSDT